MAKDKITLGNPILVNKAKPLDFLYGPYESVELANAGIPQGLRYLGLTVAVINEGSVKEYWYKEGVFDSNLVEKDVAPPSPDPPTPGEIDADTLQGHPASDFAPVEHQHHWKDIIDPPSPSMGGDADTLQGHPASDFAPAHHDHDWSDIKNAPDFSDAESVNGYKIEVCLPSNYNPETARPDTIYFIFQTGDMIVAIPADVNTVYSPTGEPYQPVAGVGWRFVDTPSPCVNKGTYEFPIELTKSGAIWEDGTNENKTFTVIVAPYIVQVQPVVTLQATGDVVLPSALCTTPEGVTCSYIVLEGGQVLRDPGDYVVQLTLNDPNCEFPSGSTAIIQVHLTGQPVQGWEFGDGFPIVFGNAVSSEWAFGDSFPLIFT